MRTPRSKLMHLAVLVVAFASMVGFTSKGRFDRGTDEANVGPVVQGVRGLIAPLFEIRGELFAIRCELARASADPETTVVLDRLRGVGRAELGWFATRLINARSLSMDALNDEAALVANEIAPDPQVSTMAGSFRFLAKVESIRPGTSINLDVKALTRLAQDTASRERVERAFAAIPGSTSRLVEQVAEIPGLVKDIRRSASRIAKEVKRAGKGKADAIGALALDGLAGAMLVTPLVEDVSAVPDVAAAIKDDISSILATLGAIDGLLDSAGGVRPDLTWLTALKLDVALPSIDADTIIAALERAIGVRPLECPSPRIVGVSIEVPARKPSGKHWDTPFDGPDPKLTCGGVIVGNIQQDSRTANWTPNYLAPSDAPVQCQLVDADLQFDDDIAMVTFEVPEAAGQFTIPSVAGVAGTITWACQ